MDLRADVVPFRVSRFLSRETCFATSGLSSWKIGRIQQRENGADF